MPGNRCTHCPSTNAGGLHPSLAGGRETGRTNSLLAQAMKREASRPGRSDVA